MGRCFRRVRPNAEVEVKPDFGSSEKSNVEEKGVCCVGAVPFVVNYNVPMICELSDESQEKLSHIWENRR